MSHTLCTLSTQTLVNKSLSTMCGFSWHGIMCYWAGEPHRWKTAFTVNWSSVVILGKYPHHFPLHSVRLQNLVQPWRIMSHTWMLAYTVNYIELYLLTTTSADGWLKNLWVLWKLNKQVNTVSWRFFNLVIFSHWQARLKCGPFPVICERSTHGLRGFIRNTAF